MTKRSPAGAGDEPRPKDKSRYRKVEVRTWGDAKFRALSPMPPSGQGLWLFLMTGPHTGAIPGLFRAGPAAMAEELGWPLEAFREAFREVFEQGMAIADWEARVMWLPKALAHNKPESPNVVRGWRTEIDLLPECELKLAALIGMREHLQTLSSSYVDAFDEVAGDVIAALRLKDFAKPLRKPFAKTSGNQEQEQEQEQEQDKNNPLLTSSRAAGAVTPAAAVCIALRKAGIASVNPASPRLLTLIEAGATVEEFVAHVAGAIKSGNNPFAYLLGAVEGERKRAAGTASQLHRGPMPTAAPAPAPQTFRERDAQQATDRVRSLAPGIAAHAPASAPTSGPLTLDMEQ
jgi:hypothetical protein